MIDNKIFTFPNLGFLRSKLTEEELNPIKKEVNEIRLDFENSKKNNSNLAGHIKKEYVLTKCLSHVEKVLLPLVYSYDQAHSGYFANSISVRPPTSIIETIPISLKSLWVNFQEKYEFNPLHNHSGILSFVIWLDIPFDITNERNVFPNNKDNDKKAGNFSFTYLDALGGTRIYSIPADKSFNDTVIMFPSTMMHEVYPFYTSDEYRITISGNFVFN